MTVLNKYLAINNNYFQIINSKINQNKKYYRLKRIYVLWKKKQKKNSKKQLNYKPN